MPLVLLLIALLPSFARAQSVSRPPLQNLRYEEDWSAIHGVDERDPFDEIKRIDLSEDGDVWIGFGGQLRSRVESWNDFGFGGPGQDSDTFWLNRFRYYADLHVGETRFFVEGKSSFSSDRDLPGGKRIIDVDKLDLQNGFVEVPLFDSSWRVRAGRRELLFGSQRLINPQEWSNVRRTFDGVSLHGSIGSFALTAMWHTLAVVNPNKFNESSKNQQLYGLYAQHVSPEFDLDLYALGTSRSLVFTGGVPAAEDRYTVGARAVSRVADTGLAAELESAYQFGRVGTGSLDAYFVSGELRYDVAARAQPRFLLGLDYASGDRRAGGNVQTFDALFPSGRLFFGTMNNVARSNLMAISPGIALRPSPTLVATVRWHALWRSSRNDGVYNLGGAIVRPGTAGSSREVGSELDVELQWQQTRHLAWLLGYNHFFPGDFITQSGPAEDIDVVYLQMAFTF